MKSSNLLADRSASATSMSSSTNAYPGRQNIMRDAKSGAYSQSWSKHLEDNDTWLLRASRHASLEETSGPVAGVISMLGHSMNNGGHISVSATSLTEQAILFFFTQVKQIPGVIAARLYGGQTLAEQSIAVVVSALRTPVSRQIFELEGATLRSFPKARLDVQVIGLKERGIDSLQVDNSEVAAIMPK